MLKTISARPRIKTAPAIRMAPISNSYWLEALLKTKMCMLSQIKLAY